MKTLLTLLLLAASAFGQTATISDTIRTPFGGTFSGTVTVTLNSPALAQPLYSGSVTLSGWTQAVTVTAGVFTLTLYTNDLITPGGTSYTATYAPTSGSGWKETWIVPTGATTIREIRSTTVPSPSVRFTPSQITQAGATLGQGLKWDGSKWAPADVVANPMTTNGDLITRLGGVPVRVGIGSTNQVLTVSGGMPVWASGITGNASTASALVANGTNCSAGSYPLGVDASGNAEGCTAAVTASTGLSDSSALVRNNQANTYAAGNKQTFASNATTAGAAFGGGITADPSSVSAGDFWYRTDLGTFGFRNATAVDALVAGGRALSTVGSVPFVTSSGVLGQNTNFRFFAGTGNLVVGTTTDDGANRLQVAGSGLFAGNLTVSNQGTNGYLRVFDSTPAASNPAKFLTVASGQLRFYNNAYSASLMALADNGNLLLGTTTDDGVNRLQVAGGARVGGYVLDNGAIFGLSTDPIVYNAALSSALTNYAFTQNNAGQTVFNGSFVDFRVGNVQAMRLAATTRNLLLGTTTDGNFRLDVGSSGSSGTTRIYDQTPTTGSTSLVVRAGAGQGSNNLQTWQNSAGAAIAATGPTGRMFSPRFTTLIDSGWALQDDFNANVPLLLASGRGIGFSSTTSFAGALDLSLSRASANTLQVGDGSANSNGTILARIHTWSSGTEGTCDATLRGQVVMVQGGAGVADTFRVCRKDSANAYAWTALY